MNTENKTKSPVLTTDNGDIYFDWFYEHYEDSHQNLMEASEGKVPLNIVLFDVRLNNTLSMDITLNQRFRYAKNNLAREVFRLMIKITNIWFCYEAILAACDESGLLQNNKSKINSLRNDVLEDLEKNYNIYDVMFSFWGMSGDLLSSNEKYRADIQRYVDHLAKGATSWEQKRYLPDVYNRFTNHEMFSVQEVLSLAYAIRNQYVHAGESPKSGVAHYSTKIAILQDCYDFMVLFCLRLGTLVVDRSISKID